MSCSIVIAECCYRSNWGTHPIARKENNLFLLEKDEFWKNKGVDYDGKVYRSYDNWLDFSIDISDYYVFSKKYDGVITSLNLDQQLDNLAKVEDYSKEYSGIIELMIEKYGLWEYDFIY